MGQTLAQTRAAAQLYLDNPGTSALSNAQWLILINQANYDVWRDLCELEPSYFEVVSNFSVASGTASFDISGASYLNAVPYKLVEVMRMQTSGGITTSNQPMRMTPMPISEYDQRLRIGQSVYNVGGGVPRWYMLRGDRLVSLAPIPTSTTYLEVRYVPMLTALTSGDDAVEVLGGRADEFQDLVAVRAAWLANSKRQGTNPVVQQLWEEGRQRMKRSAAPRNAAEPRRVRASFWPP